MKTRAFQDLLFKKACRNKKFHLLVYSTDVCSIGCCLTTFVLMFDKVLEFLQAIDIILKNSLIDNKMFILYLGEIFRRLNELNLSLQNQDMNIVRATQIIIAFINKLMILKMKAMTHNFCHFPIFELFQASEKNWVKVLLQCQIKYRILYDKWNHS